MLDKLMKSGKYIINIKPYWFILLNIFKKKMTK